MNVFGMVTTRPSAKYTDCALKSFFEATPFCEDDQFFLIDNDGHYGSERIAQFEEITLIQNDTPLSFAANVNQIMKRAKEREGDLYFLNNDLIFTEDWITPLLLSGDAEIVSPLSNREVHHSYNGFEYGTTLELEDYLEREADLAVVVDRHRTKARGYKTVIHLPFFCIRFPYEVYTKVGLLDESYGKGGAEDNDYCLRCILEGFQVKYAFESYVLHFNGKSTWGAESEEESSARCEKFRRVFIEKWGEPLAALSLGLDPNILNRDPILFEEAKRGNYKTIIERLRTGAVST